MHEFGNDDKIGKSADVTLTTDDVHELYAALCDKGIDVTEPVTEPWSTYVKVTDPDGHTFVVGGKD